MHKNGVPVRIPSKRAVDTFDDTKTWWSDSDGHTRRRTRSLPGRLDRRQPAEDRTTIEVKDFKGRYNEQANISRSASKSKSDDDSRATNPAGETPLRFS